MTDQLGRDVAVDETALVVQLAIDDPALRRSIETSIADAGWRLSDDPTALRIADHPPADVLIVLDDPHACHAAHQAVLGGTTRVALATSSVGLVGAAIDAASGGCLVICDGIRMGARLLSSLSERQVEVLAAVARGWPNRRIAATLHLSLATTKREIAALQDALDVKGRRDLMAIARRGA